MSVYPVEAQEYMAECYAKTASRYFGALTVNEFMVMNLIYAACDIGECLDVSDVALDSGLSTPAVSRMVSRLIKQGKVIQHRHADDRRRTLLCVGPQGDLLREEMFKKRREALRRFGCRFVGDPEVPLKTP